MSRAGSEAGLKRRHHAVVFAALGDETRLSLVTTLAGGQPRSIAQSTGGSRMTRQAVTKHLRRLESAGLVHSERTGRENLFVLNPAPLAELGDYLQRVSAQWDETLARLKALVEQ